MMKIAKISYVMFFLSSLLFITSTPTTKSAGNKISQPEDYTTPGPAEYLFDERYVPFDEKTAEWQAKYFNIEKMKPRETPDIPPVRHNAPTIILSFFPNDELPEDQRRDVDVYKKGLQLLANSGEQCIILTTKHLRDEIQSMRADHHHWLVIGDYESVWDLPINKHQRKNFETTQRERFKKLNKERYTPQTGYDDAHLTAAFNAKYFATYLAVMRNPWGSDRWQYADTRLWLVADGTDQLSPDQTRASWDQIQKYWIGAVAKKLVDEDKFDRSIKVTGDTGVVMCEYWPGEFYRDLYRDSPGWTSAEHSHELGNFIASSHIGSTLGMLNFATKYMRTLEIMDKMGFYVGREEFVIPFLAKWEPGTVFSVRWVEDDKIKIQLVNDGEDWRAISSPLPWVSDRTVQSELSGKKDDLEWQQGVLHHMNVQQSRIAWSSLGGPEFIAEIVDPIKKMPTQDPMKTNFRLHGRP